MFMFPLKNIARKELIRSAQLCGDSTGGQRIMIPLNKHSSIRWYETPLRAYMWYVASLYQVQHYSDVIMGAMASQITGVSIVYLIVSSGADRRKHQSSASLAFVRVHKGPVTRKCFHLMTSSWTFAAWKPVHGPNMVCHHAENRTSWTWQGLQRKRPPEHHDKFK